MTPIEPQSESLIAQVVAQGIREAPELAAAEMVKLMQENARLEAEVAMLRARLAQLVGLDWRCEFSG